MTTMHAGSSRRRSNILVFATAIAALTLFALPAVASAATVTWTGATNTDWGTAGNWNPTSVPTSADAVIINNTSSNDPVVGSGSCPVLTPCAAASVTLSGSKSMTVSSGELDVSGAISAPAGTNVTVSGGTLTFGTLTVDNAAGLTLSSGTINGTLAASASTTLLNTGTNYGNSTGGGVTLSGSNLTLQQTTSDVTLKGTLAVGSDIYDLVGRSISASGSGNPLITVGSSGQFQNGGSSVDIVAPRVESSGQIVNLNTGELRLTNSVTTGSFGPNQYGGSIVEGGGGTIRLGASSAGEGGQVSSGGLTISNDFGGTIAIVTNGNSAGQSFDMNGHTVTMDGDLTYQGNGQHTGTIFGTGTFQAATCVSCSPGRLLIDSGDFGASANITIPSGTTAIVENADVNWNNEFTFNANGTLELSSTSILTTATPANAPTINVGGTLLHVGGSGGLVAPIVDSTGAIVNNGSNPMQFDNPNGVQTDSLQGLVQNQGSGAIKFGGGTANVFHLTGGLTTDNFTNSGGLIETAGTNPDLQLNGQTLTIDGTFTHAAGTISGSNGTIFGPGTVTISGIPTTASPGALDLTGGNLAPGGPMTVNAPVVQTANTTVSGAGAQVNVNETWSIDTHNINYTGTSGTFMLVGSTGSMTYTGTGGNAVNVPLTVNGTITDNGTGTWTIDSTNSGGCTIASCVTTIGSSATVNANSGTLKFVVLSNVGGQSPTNTLTNGTYNIADEATLELPTASTSGIQELAATVTIDSDGSLLDAGANPGLVNLGTIDSTGSLTFTTDHSELTSLTDVFGTLNVLGSSSLDNSNGSGTTFIDSSGTAKIDGTLNGTGAGSAEVESGGSLSGTGTITGNLTNGGTVHAGDSPGTLLVNGNYTQESTGALNMDINGTATGQYSVLHVSGNMSLAGTLNLAPNGSYAASAATGDVIPFGLYFGTKTGTFSTVNVSPALNGGRTMTVDYTTRTGVVEAVVGAPALPAVPVNSTPPVVSGTLISGQTLGTTNGTWTNSPTSFTYSWFDCNSAGASCNQIANQGGPAYTLTPSDVGSTIRSVVVANNAGGPSASSLSGATGVVAAPTPTPVAPTVSSSSVTGSTLKLTLSEGASVKVVIKGSLKGHKKGKKCSTSAKKGKKCTVKVRKTQTFTGSAGANAFKLATAGLKKGSYTVTVTATTSGLSSTPVTLKFKKK